jgi:hypothetical protein
MMILHFILILNYISKMNYQIVGQGQGITLSFFILNFLLLQCS